MIPRHIHTNTNTYLKLKIYIKMGSWIELFRSDLYSKAVFWGHFFFLYTKEKWCSKVGLHPFYSQGQFVYAYHVLSVSLQGFVGLKYHFHGFFGPNMDIKMGVVI